MNSLLTFNCNFTSSASEVLRIISSASRLLSTFSGKFKSKNRSDDCKDRE